MAQAVERTALGQKIIDDQNPVIFIEKFVGNYDVIHTLMREGFHLGGIYVAVNVGALGFFGKYHRHMKILRRHTGNADARGLDG